MKRLAVVLSVLVVIAAVAFVAVHRRTVKRHRSNEARGALVKPFTLTERQAMAQAACGSGTLKAKGSGKFSCSVCPTNSDFGATPAPGSPGGWDFEGAIAGSFTAADQDEAVVHASGCESHARNYGGDFLLRRSDSAWTLVRYAPGATADDKCQIVGMNAGRDALVCKNVDMHQGVVSESVNLLQFDATTPPQSVQPTWTPFLAVTDESANCGYERSIGIKPHTVQAAKIEGFEVLPENAEGRRDVAIQATISRVEPGAEQSETCPAAQPRLYRLTYHHAGDHFEAAEGYVALHAMHRDDCCQVLVEPQVMAARF